MALPVTGYPSPDTLYPVQPGWVSDNRHSLWVAAIAWLLLMMMVVPDGFDYSSLGTLDMPTSGSAASRLLWLGLLGSGTLVVAWRGGLSLLLLARLNIFLILFAGLAVASALWSIEPGVTIRRMVRLLTFLSVALALVLVGWHDRRLQAVVRPALTLLLLASLAFGLLFPQYGIHQESSPELLHAWRGLTNHKNSFGALSCISMIFWLHGWLGREVSIRAGALGTLLSLLCLFLARSSTSLVTAAFVAGLLGLLMRSPDNTRRWIPYATTVFVLLLLSYSLAILKLVPGMDVLLAPIAAITGKDLSFTGRSDIWAIISEHIQLSPWLGTGYGAYWVRQPGSPSLELLRRLYFYPESSHNGYLEVTNDLGMVGLVCLIGYLMVYVRQALHLFQRDRVQGSLFLGLFMQQGLGNLSETHWLNVMSVNCVIMTLATFALARIELQDRLYRYFGDPAGGFPQAMIVADQPAMSGDA